MTDIYTPAIQTLIDQIKADKSIVQPWRNKAIARLQEAEAFIRMGQTTTSQTPPAGTDLGANGPEMVVKCPKCGAPLNGNGDCPKNLSHANEVRCICSPDMPPRKNCPVHGAAG